VALKRQHGAIFIQQSPKVVLELILEWRSFSTSSVDTVVGAATFSGQNNLVLHVFLQLSKSKTIDPARLL